MSSITAVWPLWWWAIYFAQFMVDILPLLTRLQRGAAGLPTTAISPQQHEHLLPSHEIDLGLPARW